MSDDEECFLNKKLKRTLELCLFMKKVIRLVRLCCFFLLLLTIAVNAEIRIIPSGLGNEGERGNITVPKPTAGSETAEALPAASSDTMQFLNGDSLHGILQSIDAPTGVRWQHPEVKQIIEFAPANISRIKLKRGNPSASRTPHTCAVQLTNADELFGNLVSLDAEKLNLETWYAGKIAIQRKMIRAITPGQGNLSSLYEGPTGLEGWTAARGMQGWKYENNAFVNSRANNYNCAMGRDFKLPAASSIEFDIAWWGHLQQMMVSFYTDSFENYGYNSNCYLLNISSGYVYLQRNTRNGGQNQLGQVQVQALSQKGRARIGIRCNKEQGSIALMVDGALVQKWNDRAGFVGQGGGVLFGTSGGTRIKLSNIRISEWDGKFEEPSSAPAKSKEDVVRLVNNDKVSGSLQTIRDGKISFTTSYATVEIPVERVAQIDMAGERAEQAKRNAGDVRFFFSGRGSVTLSLERWDNQQMTGNSPNFGKLKFATDAFHAIQFNPYREKPAADPATPPDEEFDFEDQMVE